MTTVKNQIIVEHEIENEFKDEIKSKCQTDCPAIVQPVCGSNGKTYESLCLLKVDACVTNVEIEMNYEGKCMKDEFLPSTESNLYPNNNFNDDTEQQIEEKPCNRLCPKILLKVCGSNGKTYNNLCLLKLDACETKVDITASYLGECQNTKIPFEENPTMNTTHQSDNEILNSSFKENVDYTSKLNELVNIESDPATKDNNCKKPCSKVVNKICGSNVKTYDNQCLLKLDECQNGIDVYVLYAG